MDDNNKSSEFAWDNTNLENTFSKNRPKDPVALPVDTNRIDTGAYLASMRITELTNQHEKAKLIFKLLRLYLTTPQFNRIKEKSRQAYLNAIHYFVTWLNTKDDVSIKVVKKFETEQVNNKKIKPESTGASEILFCLKQALSKSSISGENLKFINLIVTKSNLIPNLNQAAKQATLTGFFLEHSWIENVLGNQQFLKLASPKCLLASFKIVVSESLSYLQEARKVIRSNAELKSILQENSISHDDRRLIAKFLSVNIQVNNSKQIQDYFSNILFIEHVSPKYESQILENIQKGNGVMLKSVVTTQVAIPDFFEKEISRIESLLMAFLCASICVQPDDIFKLSRKHFAIERNSQNIPRHISINYFKGRSNSKHDTPIISLRQPLGRAMYQYIKSMPQEQELLFTEKIDRIKFSAYSLHAAINDNSISSFLIRLWQSSHFKIKVMKVLKAEGVSTLFLDCMSALSSPDATPYTAWKRENNGLYKEYLDATQYSRPIYFFWLAQIKNTAVHSNSDKYRSGDLVNYNSHTPLTEKTSYLGPDNQEFINQAGRITRAVLQQMETSIYKPNLDKIQQAIQDKNIRSHLVDITRNDDLKVNAISNGEDLLDELDFDDIRIIESEETVVQMLHYIAQADKYSEQLISKNPDYFYMTVLIKVEWSKYVLSELFNPKSDSLIQGKKSYERIKDHLPDLFTNELLGGIG